MIGRYAGSAYGPRWFLAETPDGMVARRLWDPTPTGVRAREIRARVRAEGALCVAESGGARGYGADPLSALEDLERVLDRRKD